MSANQSDTGESRLICCSVMTVRYISCKGAIFSILPVILCQHRSFVGCQGRCGTDPRDTLGKNAPRRQSPEIGVARNAPVGATIRLPNGDSHCSGPCST